VRNRGYTLHTTVRCGPVYLNRFRHGIDYAFRSYSRGKDSRRQFWERCFSRSLPVRPVQHDRYRPPPAASVAVLIISCSSELRLVPAWRHQDHDLYSVAGRFVSMLRGHKRSRIFNRHIRRAFAARVVDYRALDYLDIVGVILLSALESKTPECKCICDFSSRFQLMHGGLSTGLTTRLTALGKLWLSATMYFGAWAVDLGVMDFRG